jgi:hypothetical protein
MRNRNLLCALLYLGVLVPFAAVAETAESHQTITVSMRPYKGGRPVVALKVNGAGPYDFLVDTGATVTVLDTALFDELGLRAEGSSTVTSSAGVTIQNRSVVKEISLDCLSFQNVMVVSMKSPVTYGYPGVRGILGENFLRHFDILFDNQHRKMILDPGQSLADSLAGERLPITYAPLPQEDENRFRPMISVRVERYGRASLLLDSGAATLVLLQWREQWTAFGHGMRLRTVNGSLPCESTTDRVSFGKGTVSDFMMLKCPTATVKAQDRQGVLPTAVFKQIFISHAGSYAIIEPAQRCDVPQEMAAVTLLSQ